MRGTERLKSALADRYLIERELGSGGMATVYLARDIKHDREVALKVLRSELSAVIGTQRFLSEVRIAAKLDHPHILTLIDSGEADGTLYYVLPYVRGESLRSKLQRDKQLTVEDALSIARQVASALDYAHSRDVVHRDIKPENIMFHEGEVVLTDFGIALAVKEAGGNRLTETGLSLGTPLYMSPEQATGDRSIDKRSDIYSLAAVLYEMLAGEPPITGTTAHAIIAKLLTERPVRLRVVRPAIPVSIEAAVEKALSKNPADRFVSAGTFVQALSTAAPQSYHPRAPFGRVGKSIAGIAVLALIAFGWWMSGRDSENTSSGVVSLRDRKQLTTSGDVRFPRVSPDGKSFAYVVNECNAGECRYAVDLQDIGGSSRRVVEGATSAQTIELSPDRRHLLVDLTYKGAYGTYLVSTLGGEPRRIVTGSVTFWAEGDSLLVVKEGERFDSTWIFVTGLDGVHSDSIRVRHSGRFIWGLAAVPLSNRIVFSIIDRLETKWYSIDRTGREYDVLDIVRPRTFTDGTMSADALWLRVWSGGAGVLDQALVVRIPFDAVTGKFGSARDTVYTGHTTAMSVTADGAHLVLDEGLVEHTSWVLSFDDMINDNFTRGRRIGRSTRTTHPSISPDGKYVTMNKGSGGKDGSSWVTLDLQSGIETPIPGFHRIATAADSTRVSIADLTDEGMRFTSYDLRTGRFHNAITTSKDAFFGWPGRQVWIWTTTAGRDVFIQGGNDKRPRIIEGPSWLMPGAYAAGSPNGRSIAMVNSVSSIYDSMAVAIVDVASGKFKRLWSRPALGGFVQWLDDEILLVEAYETPESFTYYRLKLDGSFEKMGTTQRPMGWMSASRDLKRVVAVTYDQRGDAWMMKVVR